MHTGMAQIPNTFILGVHHFCDHRCWRCPLSDRCRVPARVLTDPEVKRAAAAGPAGRVAAAVLASLYVTVEEVDGLIASAPERPRFEQASLAARSRPKQDFAAVRTRTKSDPLVAAGKEYADGSLRVVQALRPILSGRGDSVALDAAERLEEICTTIASKIHRAVLSALSQEPGEDDAQTDANGSAKVALLLIEESRQAWRTLMQPGRSIADGAPARFVAGLDGLESGLLKRFPRALEFIRPGFDTPDAGGMPSELARAILGMCRVRDNA